MCLRYLILGAFCFIFLAFPSVGFPQETDFSPFFSQDTTPDPSIPPFPVSKQNTHVLQGKPSDALLESASPEARTLFEEAKASFDEGKYAFSKATLDSFLSHYPESPLLSEVYLLLSDVHRARGALGRAADFLRTFLERFPEDSRVGQIRFHLSGTFFELGDLKGVIRLWEAIPDEANSKMIVYDNVARSYADRAEYLDALHVMMKKRALVSDPLDKNLVEHEIALLIRENLEEEGLLSVMDEFGAVFPADEAIIRLISHYDLMEDYYKEERTVQRFIAQFPRHRFVGRARHLLDQIKNKIKSDRYLIAVLLPLSGRLGLFGNRALHGVELALQLFKEELPGASVNLVIRDLEEDPSRLRVRLEDWLEDYQPIAVVGPLLSKEVNRIVPLVEAADLVLITPGATSKRLRGLGRSVFRNAVTNQFLCQSIAEYAVVEMTLQRFAVLYPDEKRGRRWVDCFSEGVEDLGGEVVLSEAYPLGDTDFSRTILRLKKNDLAQDGLIEVITDKKGETENLYTPGFEAIFLPADAVRAGLIIPQLLFHDFKEVRVLGTNSWNSPEFLKLVGPYAEGVVFVDGFFTGASDSVVQTFVSRYKERFHQDPDLFAAQSYDATRLILEALKAGALTPHQVKTAVAETIDFPGASGFIYEILGGEAIKEAFYIEVQSGKFVHAN